MHIIVALVCAGILVPNSFVEDMKQTLQRVAQQAEADSSGTADNPIEL